MFKGCAIFIVHRFAVLSCGTIYYYVQRGFMLKRLSVKPYRVTIQMEATE